MTIAHRNALDTIETLSSSLGEEAIKIVIKMTILAVA